MTVPTATYRLQFRNGMTFDRARALIPYLKRLGISHLYASPIFTATAGSTHGYDVTDANEIDPAIGGREGFERLSEALQAAGLGLILDIVPNHMAASLENPWWRDVIELGEESRYARHFDIDWSRRLTLPFLGDTFEAVLEAGDIAIRPDPETGRPVLAYYDSLYPLNPKTYEGREADVLAITDKSVIATLHDRQSYRLMSWREAPRDLSYRRFFEITGLAGMRVEDPGVFDDTHRLILELVWQGKVNGLRVDHVDGLADPKAYLERLRREAGPNCHVTVEKILGEGEEIAADWPIAGTTGYEFAAAISDVFIDNARLPVLRQAYKATIGDNIDTAGALRDAKLLMADRNFAGEAARLARLAMTIQAVGTDSDQSEPAIRSALRELLIGFPVYRTYGTAEGMPDEGRAMLEAVAEAIVARPDFSDHAALVLINDILLGNIRPQAQAQAGEFRIRFQQLTGPLMAKSVEDTLFFRQHMLLALNEVGAEPLPGTFSVEHFHRKMQARLERQPDALSGTSTHDTKRGEDARARLYTLSEAPGLWATAVARWRTANAPMVKILPDGPAPEPAVEWMIYQALAGVWPTDLHWQDAEGVNALEERFLAFLQKALREAKLRTDWADVNETYEGAVIDYARHLLSASNGDFLSDFQASLQPFVRAGLVNSLTQAIIKLTAPGVPDIYQGCEGLDFSLVDPDNRREPDFAGLQAQLGEAGRLSSNEEDEWLTGRLKQNVTASLLRLRQEAPTLFRRGEYLPLEASGKRAAHIIAYARADLDDALIVIAPRLVMEALHGDLDATDRTASIWAETEIALPGRLANRRYRDISTGRTFDPKTAISINWAFADHPFAILKEI